MIETRPGRSGHHWPATRTRCWRWRSPRTDARLATGGADGTVILWELADLDRQVGPPLTGHTGEVWGAAFAPDGRTLATARRLTEPVILWDLTDRDRPRQLGQPLTGNTAGVWGVTIAPDGRTLATANANGTVSLWDLTDRDRPHQLGQPLTGHADAVYAVAFAPDGRTLATASADGHGHPVGSDGPGPAPPARPAPDRPHGRGVGGGVRTGRTHLGDRRCRRDRHRVGSD